MAYLVFLICNQNYRRKFVPTKLPPTKAPKPKKAPFVQPVIKFKPEVPTSVSEPETTRRTEAQLRLKVPPGVKPKPKRKADSPER